jgi:hypothetical protein
VRNRTPEILLCMLFAFGSDHVFLPTHFDFFPKVIGSAPAGYHLIKSVNQNKIDLM